MEEDSIIIQDASIKDVYTIRKVQKETWLATYPNEKSGITLDDIKAKIDEMQSGGIERLKKRIQEDVSSHTYIAKIGNEVIGFIGVQKQDDKNRIRALYVLPKYQKQGIGRQLINKGLQWLGTDKSITLEVVAYNNNAIEFYKSFGFIENGPTVNEVARLPSGKILPEIEMIKTF